MTKLKLCGVRLNVKEKKVLLLAGVLVVTAMSLMLVLLKAPQLDSLGNSPAQHESHDRNLKRMELLTEVQNVADHSLADPGESKVKSDGRFGVIEEPVLAVSSPSLNHSDASSRNETFEGTCKEWVSRAPKAPYFLSVVANVRIYEKDKAKLTSKELKSWLLYLRYIGIEHVYLYDAWMYKNESQLSTLQLFLDEGYITYTNWHSHTPYNTKKTMVAAYQDCIDRHKEESKWQVAIDIDEFPFSPTDTAPGFLQRFVTRFSQQNPKASEISMQNFLYLGKPLDKELMIERLFRRTPKPSNPLVKPIYKPKNVRAASVHHNHLSNGKTVVAPVQQLRMNHYWGARLQDWGEDTSEILEKTEPDHSIQPIIDAFKDCEGYIRPYLM